MYEQIASNKRRSTAIIIGFGAVIILLGYLLGLYIGIGWFGIPIAAAVAISSSVYSFFKSDSLILTMSRARPAEKNQHRYLLNTVEGLCLAAGLPLPAVFVIEDSAPNAFATGRDPQHASVVVTSGLMEKLNRIELEGVLAHELAHIKNYDIRLQTFVVVFVGLVILFSDWIRRSYFWGGRRRSRSGGSGYGNVLILVLTILLALLAPLIAQMLRLALSRQREYLADATGALLTRYPPGLASALRKISADREPLEVANKATAHLYIINPLLDHRGKLNSLFNTHPPVEERINRLEQM